MERTSRRSLNEIDNYRTLVAVAPGVVRDRDITGAPRLASEESTMVDIILLELADAAIDVLFFWLRMHWHC
jgi:hypothetical protein